jgi:hypothetical protein
MKFLLVLSLVLSFAVSADEYLGQYTVNPYTPNSVTSPYSTVDTNAYSVTPPKLYDNSGNYRGELSTNKYSADSIANPYGKYGSKYSVESVNNPYGAGSKYKIDSPNNPYGNGLKVYSNDKK